jgi:DNA-binding PadR family transcriptional regulator
MHYYYYCSFYVKYFLRKIAQAAVDMRPSKHHNVVLIMLGEFEYLILSAAVRLQENAYGAAIRQEVETASKRRCSIGALYTTLDRLENKGLIKTAMGDPTPQRGGRPKRMVRLTGKGVQAASEFYATMTRVSRGVSWAVPGRNES